MSSRFSRIPISHWKPAINVFIPICPNSQIEVYRITVISSERNEWVLAIFNSRHVVVFLRAAKRELCKNEWNKVIRRRCLLIYLFLFLNLVTHYGLPPFFSSPLHSGGLCLVRGLTEYYSIMPTHSIPSLCKIAIPSRWTLAFKPITFDRETSIAPSRKFPKRWRTLSLISKTA